MSSAASREFTTPRDDALALRQITNAAGMAISVLPSGAIFAIEHVHEHGRTMVNQVLGSPVAGGIGRIVLQIDGTTATTHEIVGPGADVRFGLSSDRFVWAGETAGVEHRVTLWLHPTKPVWLWRAKLTSALAGVECSATLVQDVGLGGRGFLMNNEAYGSQYTDHHIATHVRFGPVVMSRQNLAQDGAHPWVAHGCIDGATSFATDALQVFGPAYRDAGHLTLADGLPAKRLQHEVACPTIQSRKVALLPGEATTLTFFGLYEPDHGAASSDADLERLADVEEAGRACQSMDVALEMPQRALVELATPLVAAELGTDEIRRLYPVRSHEEHIDGQPLSFFTPDGAHNRHVVLSAKERIVPRRHGTIMRSGQGMLLDERTMGATCWMAGVFAAQLTVGNTSFHKLFSVSRDPYNITRGSGLRIMADSGDGWRLLAVPSAFEIGLSDCRWVYRLADCAITVHGVASGDDAAMQWRVTVEGGSCRFLVFGHLVLGERELDHSGRIEVDPDHKRITLRPDPEWIWGQHYPDAAYHIVTSTPGVVDAVGGDELLYPDGVQRSGAYVALRTTTTRELCFAVVGSMTDVAEAKRLAAKYEGGVTEAAMLAPAAIYWKHVTRSMRLSGDGVGVAALDTTFPWFAHNVMIHLTTPHGLEQYTGGAWGTRDACQGPVEYLLAMEHDAPVKDILRIVFAQQYATKGDWPQWFMLEPYSFIQDRHSHGDVIVWPLKALCDYLEATNDLAFLDEPVAWRDDESLQKTTQKDTVYVHVEKLLATVRDRFIPGTHLIRYGEGDWNDALQPADPTMRDSMVSSWTVALLFQQTTRYAEVLRRAGRAAEAAELDALAGRMRDDLNSHLVRDGVLAGYGLYGTDPKRPELLMHPSDTRTGLRYSLLPMKRCIIGRLFTPEQAKHHLGLIREHLLFPDGVRLMDHPPAYTGGIETFFRRAESASYFGREIGLMYVHAHLRYAEAMAKVGEREALWEALQLVNPVAVTERVPHASLRQRNTYFSSSDAAFADRYAAEADWARVKAGDIAVDGGWRIYSSGPGLYTNMLVRHALGITRYFGERITAPKLPASLGQLTVEMHVDGTHRRWQLGGDDT